MEGESYFGDPHNNNYLGKHDNVEKVLFADKMFLVFVLHEVVLMNKI